MARTKAAERSCFGSLPTGLFQTLDAGKTGQSGAPGSGAAGAAGASRARAATPSAAGRANLMLSLSARGGRPSIPELEERGHPVPAVELAAVGAAERRVDLLAVDDA